MKSHTTTLTTFEAEGYALRAIELDGQHWFIAADVCAALDYDHVPHAMRVLDDDEKAVHKVDTLGGAQNATVINESGLYSLILSSRKPEAKRFKKWVTAEVLPSIRKTGGYGEPRGELAQMSQMTQMLGTVLQQVLALQKQTLDVLKSFKPTRRQHRQTAPDDVAWVQRLLTEGCSYKEIVALTELTKTAVFCIANNRFEIRQDGSVRMLRPNFDFPQGAA